MPPGSEDSSRINRHAYSHELSFQKVAQYDKIYFPRCQAFRDGSRIRFTVSGEGGRIAFYYDAVEEKLSYALFNRHSGDALVPIARETTPFQKDEFHYPFGQYTIRQLSTPGCNDTKGNALFIKKGKADVLSVNNLGNVAMYSTDLNNDGFKEMYIVNTYSCVGIFELYRLDKSMSMQK